MQETYFWSLILEGAAVQAGIWTIHEQTARVLYSSDVFDYVDNDDLIASSDKALSMCIQKLPENIKAPTKTVFGVPSSWVVDGQIERTNLDKIKLICEKLSLSPTGFVVMPEAIAHFMKSQEKTPVSAVLVGIYKNILEISVFRLGNLVGSVSVARSENVIDDVVEGLVRFGNMDPFSSRFLVYDSNLDNLEDIKQELIKAHWEILDERIKFLHTPQVEVLTSQEKMAAISLAGAVEIGHLSNVTFDNGEHKPEVSKYEELSTADNISGVVDASTLGFSMGRDIPKIPLRLPKLKSNLKLSKHKENLIFVSLLLFLVLFTGAFLAWWFLPKAQITIMVSPKKIEAHKQIIFDQNINATDFNNLKIPAKLVNSTLSLDKTKTTTGTKTIGNSSKGSVTFYNVGGGTTLSSGTILIGSGLKYSLEKDVTIASASGAASAATAQGTVTSVGVGADYNLASGTIFSVSGFSSSLLQAKNDTDLTGGSSQEVTAVSKDDLDSLIKDLTNELMNSGKNNLKNNLPADHLLIDSSLQATPSSKNFDHNIGDEATTIKLSESVKINGLTISRKDMNDLAARIFANQIPNGFVIDQSQIDFVVGAKDTDFIINLIPKIDKNKLASDLSGKTTQTARAILSRTANFQDIQIKMVPPIPFLQFLPHVKDNITIIVTTK